MPWIPAAYFARVHFVVLIDVFMKMKYYAIGMSFALIFIYWSIRFIPGHIYRMRVRTENGGAYFQPSRHSPLLQRFRSKQRILSGFVNFLKVLVKCFSSFLKVC